MNSIINLSAQQLRRAAAIKEQIQTLEKKLGGVLGSSKQPVIAAPKKRRKMSAAGRAKISAAAKARWEKVRAKGK